MFQNCQFVILRPPRKIGELHMVLGLEDLGPVNLQQLIGAQEVGFGEGRDNYDHALHSW